MEARPNGRPRRAFLLTSIVSALIAAGCATTPAGPPKATHVATWAYDMPDRGHDQSFWQFLDSVASGAPRYDHEFDRPGAATLPTPVDCQNVEFIATILFIDGSNLSKRHMTQLRLDTRWTHSDVLLEGHKYDRTVREVPRPGRYRIRQVGQRNLDLTGYFVPYLMIEEDFERTSGTYTLVVEFDGVPLHTESFEFVAC